ncbi:hypothetical protein COOONC_04975 [Cooperia oncophora]
MREIVLDTGSGSVVRTGQFKKRCRNKRPSTVVIHHHHHHKHRDNDDTNDPPVEVEQEVIPLPPDGQIDPDKK